MLRLRGRKLRLPLPALVCAGIAAMAPLVALAQAPPNYAWDPTWPLPGQEANGEFRLQEGLGVTIDRLGRIYLGHATKNPILVYDRAGNFLGSWGQGQLSEPHSVRADPEGNIWVVERDFHQIIKFSPNGQLLAAYGKKGKRGTKPDQFNEPTDMAFGPNGDIYVADGYKNNRVVRLSRDLQYLGEWGRKGSKPGQFSLPHGIATDRLGRVFVADRENKRIQVFGPDGTFLYLFKTKEKPFSVFVTPDDRIFLANAWAHTISIHDMNGTQLGQFGYKVKDRPKGILAEPHMLTVDGDGTIYEGEMKGHRWQKWVPR